MNQHLLKTIFGRLTWESFPVHEPILLGTFLVVMLGGLGIVGAITRYRLWGWLWREWFTSVDHKKIGIMYVILGIVMLLRGFSDAIMMRVQQAIAFGDNPGYLPPHHYDQIFTAHGTIMIFFVAIPLVVGLINFVMPLQIGARDVAFPFLNNLSFWLTVAGAVLTMTSLFVGEFARTGWLSYAPLAELAYSPDTGVDYYLWSLEIAGVGTTLSAINMVATIIKLRAPGMTMMKMPIFCWTALCSNVLAIAIFPILTAAFTLLALDRYVGTNFFTNELGGNPMMYWNLVWIWGHPEVYVLVLPAFGIYSEITSTFTGKRLFGYSSMVYATVVITILSFLVWLHHFFTMGSGASVNSFFGIATMVISIPTGAKIFNWLFTMYRGRIRYELPMMWTVAFMLTFTVGGMTGVLLAMPPADFVLHNSLFLVAHFHNVIIGGVVFGLFAGITYWFPKAFGFRLDPWWGKVGFWGWVIGYWVAWTPIYVVGLMGTTRRVNHFDDPTLQPWFVLALVGVGIIAVGIFGFLMSIVMGIRRREQLRDTTGDPWHGRTLEWSTSSPPPAYNFALTPVVHDLDAWYDMKARGYERPADGYRPIHMPRNTGTGVILSALALAFGFGMVWYMWWLAAISLAGILAVSIGHTFNYARGLFRPTEDVARTEGERTVLLGGERLTMAAEADPRATWHLAEEEEHGGGATLLGFWIYLMSDALIFAALFATFGVVGTSYAGGPSPREAFELPLVAVNTGLLLVSSLTFGFAMLAMEVGRVRATQAWLGVTALFGLAFVAVEMHEFAGLIAAGATPQRSAFLSAFFTLVGTHGLHVTLGLVWIATMLVQVGQRGLIPENRRRLMCLSMFWHFLDIIWIGVFTFVYLFGMIR